MDERMVKKQTTFHKNVVYQKNDKVQVRIQGSRGRLGPKRRHVVERKIVKKGKNSNNCPVIVQMPYAKEKEKNGSL